MDLEEIILTADEAMDKSLDYLKNELRGVRTGRASTGLVEYVKVDYYGSQTDLRQLALINVTGATQILIKPFDPTSTQEIAKAIQQAGLGLNPIVEPKQIRLSLPSLSGDRRQELIGSIKQMGEQAKVSVRNARRDGNKHIDQAARDKDNPIGEDEAETAKQDVQELLKKHEQKIDQAVEQKTREVQEV